MPNVSRTPVRTVRVSDEVWGAAKAKADAQRITMSEVIRDALVNYAGLTKGTCAVLGREDREA